MLMGKVYLFLKGKSYCRKVVLTTTILLSFLFGKAQCPPNIDFELGDFTGWKCYTQNDFAGVASLNLLPTAPLAGRHIMLSNPPGNGNDPYGNFPQNCPNGSGHSVRVGASQSGGHTADRISYTFTIPAGQNDYNLIYHYAIVLNDASHPADQQPRLQIEIKNITDGTPLPCPMAPFVATSSLPGFQTSALTANGQPVRYKPWSAASLKLNNLAGKTIEVSFTTTGCGLYPNGTHFGYAYIDINSTCSSAFTGATFCPDDTSVTITGPYGYASYQWFNHDYTQLMGTTQTITLNPPPLSGDSLFCEITPYNGYGCKDTLIAHLWDTLTVHAYAGKDTSVCPNNPVQLGGPPEPGLVYHWLPVTGLSDPDISNPVATAGDTTQYVLYVQHNGGGCLTMDTVNINVPKLADTLILIGDSTYCIATGDSTILQVIRADADSIQWYKNGAAIPGATQTSLRVTQSGVYHATVFNSSGSGCSLTTRDIQVDIYPSPAADFAIDDSTQCLNGNVFNFHNNSTISSGALQYFWDFGDGNTATTQDATHTYAQAGTYTVKLLAGAAGGCSDSLTHTVYVYPDPSVGFTVNNRTQCFAGNQFVFQNNTSISAGNLLYTWDMGNSVSFITRDITYNYPVPGTYNVILHTAGSLGGCAADSTMSITVNPSPVASSDINASTQCLPNNQFVFTNKSTVYAGTLKYNWDFGDGTTDTVQHPVHTYQQAGTYLVKLKATAVSGGCTNDTSFYVTVNEVAYADFSVSPVCVNVRVPVINRTRELPGTATYYYWDFGDGTVSTDKTPRYAYPLPGHYDIKLKVSSSQCPTDFTSKTWGVLIDAPATGITYPVKEAITYYPEKLQARSIGNNVLWMPPASLSSSTSYTPVFNGGSDQVYTIQLRTPTGCITVDTQYVHTRKNIKIYVPTAFTPGNGDGLNDYLRPILMSFTKLNYFRIYDRWGKLLFEMNDKGQGWDGRISGSLIEPQTVIWVLEATDQDGEVHKEKGSTVILR